MNTYTAPFFANCPANDARIIYSISIDTDDMIFVEDLLEALEAIESGYHEEIADALHKQFGGKQTILATHHGVHIKTVRG